MDIKFNGKYKSINSFEWTNIPKFVIITGPNGTGKSQLLELIHQTFVPPRNANANANAKVSIINASFKPSEITFLKGEWQIQNTSSINLATLLSQTDQLYQSYVNRNYSYNQDEQIRINETFQDVQQKIGKNPKQTSKEEFLQNFPEIFVRSERTLSQNIAEIFYNYRLSEIELLAEQKTSTEIEKELGVKPWDVLREIIKEAKLPFEINDPSKIGIRDSFHLKLTHTILNEEINFDNLSSGEKVLMSLIFYLYNSQENGLFPKLLLLDEPDAHLHPTMSQQFLNVIKNVLVDKFNVQVIMTTHSPSTVMLAPQESIYEMSRTQPRIIKSPSKNHSVSLLTSGLVYVGEGTKYFLVEDNDDVTFYSFAYNQLITDNLINANIPLVFIPASTKNKSGGKNIVQNWVEKLTNSGLVNVVQGLIDADYGNQVFDGLYKIERYSIENYLIDPVLVYAALIDKEKNPAIDNLTLTVGEEYKLKFLSSSKLQEVADKIIDLSVPYLSQYFTDFDHTIENERKDVKFQNGITLQYPKWIFDRRGKTILHQVYNDAFTSPVVNFSTLFKAMRKLNLIPEDLTKKLIEIQNGC